MNHFLRRALVVLLVTSLIGVVNPGIAAPGGKDKADSGLDGLEIAESFEFGPVNCLSGEPLDIDDDPATDDRGKLGVGYLSAQCFGWSLTISNSAKGKSTGAEFSGVTLLSNIPVGFNHVRHAVTVLDSSSLVVDPATAASVCQVALREDSEINGNGLLITSLGLELNFESGWSCIVEIDVETQKLADPDTFYPMTCVALTDDEGFLLRALETNEVLFEWPELHAGTQSYNPDGTFNSNLEAMRLSPYGCPLPLDTDGDDSPDFLDPDDDNDGWTDEEEIAAGSDPKDPNSTPQTTSLGIHADPVGGDDGNDGSKQLPVKSLSRALILASQQSEDVYLAQGIYFESNTIDLVDGVSIFGGYNVTNWTRGPSSLSEIRVNSAIGFFGSEIAANTELDQLKIVSADALAGSSYGLQLLNSGGVVFRNGEIVSGNGVNGNNGVSGSSGSNGSSGGAGQNGVDNDGNFGCSTNPTPVPGIGASGVFSGGNGGSPGLEGTAGQSGTSGNGPNAGSGGAGGAPDSNGINGGAGLEGATGASGSSGTGSFTASGFVASAGLQGAIGNLGGAGGGGGGGGGGNNLCDSYGGAGGGGGSGGTGGGGGSGGMSGGGSFAVYLWDSSLTVTNSTLLTGNGGNGGHGGLGGTGGTGGAGGLGGDGEDDSGAGGNGGHGGDGGRGGQGGGGQGGHVIGVLRGGTSQLNSTGNTFSIGNAGSGGSPNGATGISANTY